jgi:hypothetical protein
MLFWEGFFFDKHRTQHLCHNRIKDCEENNIIIPTVAYLNRIRFISTAAPTLFVHMFNEEIVTQETKRNAKCHDSQRMYIQRLCVVNDQESCTNTG